MKNRTLQSIFQAALEKEIHPAEIRLWPAVKDRLVARKSSLLQQREKVKITQSRRIARIAFVTLVFVALLVVAFLTPPGQAFAQDILRRIGNIVISNESPEAERYVATLQSGTPTPTAVCQNCGSADSGKVVDFLTVDQASEKAGFPVFEPEYIPVGYQVNTRDVFVSESSTVVDTSYYMELDPPLHNGMQMRGIISISQIRFSDTAQSWKMDVGEVPLVEVVVRSQPGIWLEQVPVTAFQNENGEWDYARWNQLMWAEDGHNFWMQTNMPSDLLPLEELLKIAESLSP